MTIEFLELTPPYSRPEGLVVVTAHEFERALESGAPTIIIDSLTALAREANRTPSDDEPKHQISSGIVSQRLRPLKELMARAQTSSQKVIAIIRVNSGSRIDEVIADEFRDTF